MTRHIPSTAAAIALALSLGAPLAAQAADAMRVVLDPKTGEMRAPNAAETLAFERADAQLRAARGAQASGKTNTRPAGTEIRYADGTVETILGEDTHMYSVVKSDAQGNLNFDCLPSQEAQKFVKSTSARKSAAKSNVSAKTAVKAGHEHQ